MKYNSIPFLVVFTTCVGFGQSGLENKVVELIGVDLDGDSQIDSISLMNPPDGDPGEFHDIRFQLSRSREFSFRARDIWDNVDPQFLRANTNAVESQRVFIFRTGERSIVLLFGYIYGSGRDEFSIIRINGKGAKLLFDQAFATPIQIVEEIDGAIIFVGRKHDPEYITSVDSLNADIEVYQPFSVYHIDSDLKLDQERTRRYNEEHYVWMGLENSGIVRVLCPRDGSKYKVLKK